jgi:integrase
MSWFEKDSKERTLQNNIQNEKRAYNLLKSCLNSDRITSIEEFDKLLNHASTIYCASVIIRMLNVWKKYSTISIDFKVVKSKLRKIQFKEQDNFIHNDETKIMLLKIINILHYSEYQKNETSFFCLFLLCAMFGLRVSDAADLTYSQLNRLYEEEELIIQTKKNSVPQKLSVHHIFKKKILLLIITHMPAKFSLSNVYSSLKKFYEVTFSKPKQKKVGFHALRFKFSYNLLKDEEFISSILDEDEKIQFNNLLDRPKNVTLNNSNFIQESEQPRQTIAHSKEMSKYYQKIEFKNEHKNERDNKECCN